MKIQACPTVAPHIGVVGVSRPWRNVVRRARRQATPTTSRRHLADGGGSIERVV